MSSSMLHPIRLTLATIESLVPWRTHEHFLTLQFRLFYSDNGYFIVVDSTSLELYA